jgi:signal transduction histidine kinase
MTAWADMLSMIGRKNSRLYDFVVRTPRPRSSGNAILRELERERSRIARELHAGAGQPLAGIKLNLEMLDDCFEALPERGRQALTRVQKLVEQALEQVRAVSHSLHPPVWQDLTTAEAIRTLIDATGLGSRMAVELDIDPFPIEPPHAVKVALYRCAQECISNIMRHSGATSFRLGLKANGSMLELRIEDNGHGFHGDARSRGIGLQVLREHADTLDGVCRIASGPTGTTITVALPLTED